MFIVIEGLDGTGKSTLARSLAQHLGAIHLRTPDESLASVRPILDAMLSETPSAHTLFYWMMVQHAAEKARRLVSMGDHVVLDRYWGSTVAYDAVIRRSGLPFEQLVTGLFRPDLTLFLEASRVVRQARISARGGASAEDRRGLDPDVDAQLCSAYDAALAGPCVGQLVRLNVDGATPGDVLRTALNFVTADVALGRILH